jgi:hypothetical protein
MRGKCPAIVLQREVSASTCEERMMSVAEECSGRGHVFGWGQGTAAGMPRVDRPGTKWRALVDQGRGEIRSQGGLAVLRMLLKERVHFEQCK